MGIKFQMSSNQKHENYDILNLIGYGLSKFNMDFIKNYGFNTKTAFYEYIVSIGIAKTIDTVKNRQDLFDGMTSGGSRKGWWQKGAIYKFRKDYIDSLFGNLNVKEFIDVVKMSIAEKLSGEETNFILLQKQENEIKTSPMLRTQFKQMQQTGIEAEFYFLNNYTYIDVFCHATINDARLFGDGYDFQMTVSDRYYLAEIKGLKSATGSVRMTKNEYEKAMEYTNDYALVVVSNLTDVPKMISIFDPIGNIEFEQHKIINEQFFYTSKECKW